MKILAYSSAMTFGGHEVMSLKGIRALLMHGHQVILQYPARNDKMRAMCAPLNAEFSGQFSTVESAIHSRRMQIFFTWLDWRVLLNLRSSFKRLAPDVILVLQGDIEQGSEAVLAASIAGIRSVSYIPMVMSGKQRGIRLAGLRDLLCRPLYSICNKMIVISAAFEAQAHKFGAQDVAVVYNCIDLSFFEKSSERDRVRLQIGVREGEFVTGFVGRVSYAQKGIDRLLEILQSDVDFFSKNRMLLLGSGPDDQRLTADLRRLNLAHLVHRLPWNDARHAYFDCLDLFLCTSRFEGIPLTVLEASARNVAVLSMPLPTLVDHLPLHFTSAAFEAAEWVRRIKALAETDGIEPDAAYRLVRVIAAPATFEEQFQQAVASAAPPQVSIPA